MIIPIRCFSCGKPIGQFWDEFKRRADAGEDIGKVLDDLGIERYCCRACMMGHADMLPEISKFKKS